MSVFQEELRSEGYEDIVIIAVGSSELSTFNNGYCANSNLPLVMDQSPNFPLRTQFSPFSNTVVSSPVNGGDLHSELFILDENGQFIESLIVSNVSDFLKNQIRSIIAENYPEQILMGDINLDATVNIQDIVYMINIIMGNFNATSDQILSGDLNSDSLIDVSDIVLAIQIILN